MVTRFGPVARIVRLAAISSLAKGPGFLIPVVIAAFFGAGPVTDAYFLAYGGVLLVGGTIGQPLEAVVVPFAAHALALGRKASDRFMSSVFRHGIAVGLGASALGALVVWGALRLSAPQGVSAGDVLVFYLLLAPAAVAWCVAGLYSGALVAGWHLEIGAIGYGFRGIGALLGAIAGILLGHLWPVAMGVSVGEWSRVWWLGHHWGSALSVMPQGAEGSPERGLLRAAASQMTAQGLSATAQFVERFIVASIAVAAVSRLEYANRLLMVAAVAFDGGVAPWLLAKWSDTRVRSVLRSDWTTVYQPITLAVMGAAVIAMLIVAAAPFIVAVVLHHGAFTDADAAVVAQLLRWYALGYVFNMSALCVERLLLARAHNRTLAVLAGARAALRISAVLILVSRIGILALPIGFLLTEALYFAALLVVSRRDTSFRVAPSSA